MVTEPKGDAFLKDENLKEWVRRWDAAEGGHDELMDLMFELLRYGATDSETACQNWSRSRREAGAEQEQQEQQQEQEQEQEIKFFFSFCQGQWVQALEIKHCWACGRCVDWTFWHCGRCGVCVKGLELQCGGCRGVSKFHEHFEEGGRAFRDENGELWWIKGERVGSDG